MTTFLERLDAACEATQSLVCVGLDPDPALMPVEGVFSFNKAIVDATHDLVCAYKPNLAFYEALGLDGLRALEQTIHHIRKVAPGAVLIGDGKRGDVTNTAAAYAKAMFEFKGTLFLINSIIISSILLCAAAAMSLCENFFRRNLIFGLLNLGK